MYNKASSEVIDSSLYDKLLGIASGKKEKIKPERKRKLTKNLLPIRKLENDFDN